ncbi:hypothetical protein C8N30_1731 [Sulfitobacter guttiformis]|uniref:Uncharacterized protein n=1 Tax=Sulfitobacter guttiformis TaxID=74349 RepID=A0A420DS53_9RHOB|nr:hypothetical protein C8N30_1731 [Sulfitobacter guttiformis]
MDTFQPYADAVFETVESTLRYIDKSFSYID